MFADPQDDALPNFEAVGRRKGDISVAYDGVGAQRVYLWNRTDIRALQAFVRSVSGKLPDHKWHAERVVPMLRDYPYDFQYEDEEYDLAAEAAVEGRALPTPYKFNLWRARDSYPDIARRSRIPYLPDDFHTAFSKKSGLSTQIVAATTLALSSFFTLHRPRLNTRWAVGRAMTIIIFSNYTTRDVVKDAQIAQAREALADYVGIRIVSMGFRVTPVSTQGIRNTHRRTENATFQAFVSTMKDFPLDDPPPPKHARVIGALDGVSGWMWAEEDVDDVDPDQRGRIAAEDEVIDGKFPVPAGLSMNRDQVHDFVGFVAHGMIGWPWLYYPFEKKREESARAGNGDIPGNTWGDQLVYLLTPGDEGGSRGHTNPSGQVAAAVAQVQTVVRATALKETGFNREVFKLDLFRLAAAAPFSALVALAQCVGLSLVRSKGVKRNASVANLELETTERLYQNLIKSLVVVLLAEIARLKKQQQQQG